MPESPIAATLAGRLARLRARFDRALLTEPQATAGTLATTWQPALTSDLQAAATVLCAGGPGFVASRQVLAAQPAQRAQQQAWLNHHLLALDGTLHMQALGGPWRQRLHRLALKAREFSADLDGAHAPARPWDCGFLNTGAGATAAAQAFEPRRPTLIVAWQLPADLQAPLLTALQARSSVYPLPVRLWVLEAPAPL